MVPRALLDVLDRLERGERPRASDVAALSELRGEELAVVRERWPRIPRDVRASVLEWATELAEDNVELDFRELALIAARDESAPVRRLAAEALWEANDRFVTRSLLRLLREDEDATVRAAAATSLMQYVLLAEFEQADPALGAEVIAALGQAVRSATEPPAVRARALESLGPCSQPWVDQLIRDAYFDADRELRIAALVAMGNSADEKWLEYLVSELSSEDPELRFHAAIACGRIGSAEAVPDLVPLLDDEDLEVVRGTIDALAEIGGEEALEHLRAFRERVPEPLAELLEEAIESAAAGWEELIGRRLP